MAIEVAMEDDVFFADLNRRISMLIDEDDDVHVSKLASFSPQEFPRMVVHPPILPSQYDIYQANRVREMSKGTGVFIPQSSQPRRSRYQQQGAKTNRNKQFTNPRGRSNNVATHTTFPHTYPTNINGY
ncbi:hypothetical protein KSS87_012097 [Heliosperma pusillum]|nr:hypothetical protein KSS87_008909 [Heliosperma pusillum]KAH9614821.1 hypothetical protein KSS87_012097 [Heliosperma pusillum]